MRKKKFGNLFYLLINEVMNFSSSVPLINEYGSAFGVFAIVGAIPATRRLSPPITGCLMAATRVVYSVYSRERKSSEIVFFPLGINVGFAAADFFLISRNRVLADDSQANSLFCFIAE